MKPIDVLTTAFAEGTTDTELRRLMRYAESGKEFLCGRDASWYAKDNKG